MKITKRVRWRDEVVTLIIDEDKLVDVLGRKAAKSKGKRATMLHGLIVVKVEG